MSLIAGMLAGVDSIDDMNLLSHGGMGNLFDRTYAPSTLRSFLREFRFGHVRQLDAFASMAAVAEIPFTAFLSRKKVEQVIGRLVVRRIPDLDLRQAEQPTVFDVYRHHALFTTTSNNDMDTVDTR